MAVNVSNTLTTSTFEFWRLRTNQMANLFRQKAVTTSSNTTPGSAAISGTFSGGNLKANGTTQSTSTTTGSLQTRGGLGVSRNAHIGGKLVVTGISNTANLNVAGTVSATLFSGNGSSLTSIDADTLDGKDSTDFASNTYVASIYSSNSYLTATFTSNNYVDGRFTSNSYINSRNLASNNYIQGRYTSNNYIISTYVSNNYVTPVIDSKATNTYVNSTFTSNGYVQGRFAANSYLTSTFVANSFLTNSFLRSDTDDTATGIITFSTTTNFASVANVASGTMKLPNTANISIGNMGSNSNKYLRVNGDGSALVFSNSVIANTGDIGDVLVDYGSISNADVLVWDENIQKFKNYPRSLIDITSIDDIDDVNTVNSRGDILVRVVSTSNTSTFANTANGFISGRLDSMRESEFTGLTTNTVSFASTSNSFIQVFRNGVKLANADFSVPNTTNIALSNNLVSADTLQVVEFNPHAFVVGDGTPSEYNQPTYSDLRLKANVEIYEASSSVFDIHTYTYYWKDQFRFHDRQEVGFVAQDIEKYIPQVVSENSQGEKMVDYGKMTAVLLSTIKQLNERIEALESKAFCTCPEE